MGVGLGGGRTGGVRPSPKVNELSSKSAIFESAHKAHTHLDPPVAPAKGRGEVGGLAELLPPPPPLVMTTFLFSPAIVEYESDTDVYVEGQIGIALRGSVL